MTSQRESQSASQADCEPRVAGENEVRDLLELNDPDPRTGDSVCKADYFAAAHVSTNPRRNADRCRSHQQTAAKLSHNIQEAEVRMLE